MNHVYDDRAVADIYLIEGLIAHYEVESGHLPASITETSAAGMLDPWGRPYRYINLADAPKTPSGKPKIHHRMDKFLNPLNTDYDLYSSGKDGQSRMPLTAAASRDDIVRAANGAYVGLGQDY
jgi:general secretion pathway protein G